MRKAGRTFLPAVAVAAVGAATLFFSSAIWLEVTGAVVLLTGATLIIGAIATPEFLEADADEPAGGAPD